MSMPIQTPSMAVGIWSFAKSMVRRMSSRLLVEIIMPLAWASPYTPVDSWAKSELRFVLLRVLLKYCMAVGEG